MTQPTHHPPADQPRLRVAITGASGLIGSALAPFLTAGGHMVVPIVRGDPRPGEVRWDIARREIDAEALEGIDAVIHLAGENIAAGRWTERRKESIRRSRVEGTRLIAETLARLARPPRVLISASAVGIYGDRGDERITEESPTGEGFLAEVGQEWEAAADSARAADIRVVHPRIGVVLSASGGALAKMLTPFRLGIAGRLGSGRQWMSWISLDDLLRVIDFLVTRDDLSGPVNATAPQPVTNAEFTRTLARVLHRPAILPIPAVAIRLLFGEMGQSLLLEGARLIPAKLQAAGFEFLRPRLEDALQRELGRAIPRTSGSS